RRAAERAGKALTEQFALFASDAFERRRRSLVEAHFRHQRLHRSVRIPYDAQLRTMLDSGTYSLEALPRETRRPIKLLGLAAAEQLV
ncbi:MAG TPA: hypothetical protein VEQ61_06595, partial [Thermoleophilaceae bacterium]|nr:hypothetical protein [Thermoleophilaceae bacterium]